jgi:hypothetical protein
MQTRNSHYGYRIQRFSILIRFHSRLNYQKSLRNEDHIPKLICAQANLMFVVWLPYIARNFTALCNLNFKTKWSLLLGRSLEKIICIVMAGVTIR